VRPLDTAHGRIDTREGLIVRLIDHEGRVGVGEAAPLPGFGLESLTEADAAIERCAVALLELDPHTPLDETLDRVDAATEKAPCARAAIDSALHDLDAKREGLSLATSLARAEGREPRQRVPVAALLHARAPRDAADEARRGIDAGYLALKMKLAAADGNDLARVEAVRAQCPAEVELRLDANAAWSEDEAARWLEALAPFRPAWVEQPVASAEALARLRARARVPLGVDEGLASAGDAARLAASRAADIWILKPAALGGLRAARRLAGLARAAGAVAVVSGFLDTAVGSAAALALAAALPDGRPAGLGPVLANDLAQLSPISDGARALPTGIGLGVNA
jgi:o-succinylbenzoate synthase